MEGPTMGLWKAKTDGSGLTKILSDRCGLNDVSPDGKYILCNISNGEGIGIYQFQLPEKKRTLLLPGVETYLTNMSTAGDAIQYPVAGLDQVTIFSAPWSDGKITRDPQPVFTSPINFPLTYYGNAYDISRDLSTLIYAKRGGQSDIFLLTSE
jgi:hypothetical protein